MCFWAVSNVAVPAAVLGARPTAATVVGLIAPLLSIHGWVFFLTYPANPARERWLVVCWSMSGRRPAAWYRAGRRS